MATTNFIVRSEHKGKMANLLIRFSAGSNLSFYVKSGFSVLSDSWNNKSQRFKSRFVKLTVLMRSWHEQFLIVLMN